MRQVWRLTTTPGGNATAPQTEINTPTDTATNVAASYVLPTWTSPIAPAPGIAPRTSHGIPSAKRILTDGDIISIDCGVIVDGYYSDWRH